MKNDKIITSWDKIEPSDSANERMLSAILERNRSVHDRKDKVNSMSRTKKTKRMLIPVAACLVALIAITGIVGNNLNWFGTKGDVGSDAGAGVDGTVLPGGSIPEGIDPVVASIAVYPADKSLSDVADATLNEINEAEAYSTIEMGDHLPTSIPDGYHFKNASIYETTMKDGTKYYLLRVNYTTGDNDSADISTHTADISVQLTNFHPNTEDAIYTMDSLPNDFSGKKFLRVVYSNVYVGFEVGDLTYDEIMLVLNSIN